MKHHIDFSKFSELDGVPTVEWNTTSKWESFCASHYPMRHDDVFGQALDQDALEATVRVLFWTQTEAYPHAEIWGGGCHYSGSKLDPAVTPVLARGVALHYITALQIMMATKPESLRRYDDICTWRKEVPWLRDHIKAWSGDRSVILAHRAMLIMLGEKKDGQKKRRGRAMWSTGFTYELVPSAYTDAILKHRKERDEQIDALIDSATD